MSAVESYRDTCQTAADVAAAAALVRQRRRSVFFVPPKPAPMQVETQPVKAPEPKVVPLHMAGQCNAQFVDMPALSIAVTANVEIPHDPILSGYTIADIQKAMCRISGTLMSEMLGHRRLKSVTEPRQIAMFLCKFLTKRSYPEIGRKFGGRDHTTVLHSVRKYEWMKEKLPPYGSPLSAFAVAAWDLHRSSTPSA